MSDIRESFASDNVSIEDKKINSPLDASKSRFSREANEKKTFSERLETKAHEVHTDMISKKEKMFSLSRQFMTILTDTNLPENKGPAKKGIEKSVLDDLANFAMQINIDEDIEPEDPNMPMPLRRSMGSITMIMLLFKASLQLRDTNNKLTFNLEKVHRNNLLLEQRVKELESKLSIDGLRDEIKD